MTASPDPTPTGPVRRTNPWLIVLAVAVVAVPLAWGVSQTVMKSTALFHHAATTRSSTTKPSKGAKLTGSTTQSATTGPTTHGSKSPKHKK